MRPQNMTKIITAALVAGVLATTPVRACDHAIVLFNWKPCAVGLLGENGEDADWAAVPAWTKNPAIRPYFFDDPRLLAVLGNTKYHRATLCLPGWQKADDKNAYWYLICAGFEAQMTQTQPPEPGSGPAPAPDHERTL